MSGMTFINGTPESATALHHLMGFVPQDDIMHQDLTVKENLTYCCQLRSDPAMSRQVLPSTSLTITRAR
jgi:ABC transport system ATP-binding/permease protein